MEYLLSHPDRSGPKGKTLFDLAAERQAELDKAAGKSPTAEETSPSSNVTDEEDRPLLTACLYSVTLAMVHFTFDVLVYHQYAQEVDWPKISRTVTLTLPTFFIIVYVLHMDPISRFMRLRQGFFFVAACIVGCYVVRVTNEEPYIAVLRRIPPLGSLWLWTVVEMEARWALASVGVVVVYLWLNGFSII